MKKTRLSIEEATRQHEIAWYQNAIARYEASLRDPEATPENIAWDQAMLQQVQERLALLLAPPLPA